MKCTSAVAILAVASRAHAAGVFGPDGCVSLSRSASGTCVIDTNCEGRDLSHVEFAFSCRTPGKHGQGDRDVPHSFGLGGFDTSETFDTDIKCKQCSPVQPARIQSLFPSTPKAETALAQVTLARTHEPQKRNAGAAKALIQLKGGSPAEANKSTSFDQLDGTAYGPNGCVSTHRSAEGRCIMKTDCDAKDISSYEFGLMCEDHMGVKVRHLFGKDSFGANETFDTLLQCDKCLALDDGTAGAKKNQTAASVNASTTHNVSALVEAVEELGLEVKDMKAMLTNVTKDVAKLNTKVFPTTAAPANDSTDDDAPQAVALVAEHRRGLKQRSADELKASGGSKTQHRNLRRHGGRSQQPVMLSVDVDSADKLDPPSPSSRDYYAGTTVHNLRRTRLSHGLHEAADAQDADVTSQEEADGGAEEAVVQQQQGVASGDDVEPGDNENAAADEADEQEVEVVDVTVRPTAPPRQKRPVDPTADVAEYSDGTGATSDADQGNDQVRNPLDNVDDGLDGGDDR